VSARTVDVSGKNSAIWVVSVPSAYANTCDACRLRALLVHVCQLTRHVFALHKLCDPGLGSTTNKSFTSLNNFINAYTTATTGTNIKYFGWSNLYFSFDGPGTATGGTVSLWSGTSNGVNAVKTSTGKASYERRTVFGQEVLIIQAQAPQNRTGQMVMFAIKDGALYGGNFTPSSVANSGEANVNKTMLNAILKAAGKPAVLN